jgi:hypothetical protein
MPVRHLSQKPRRHFIEMAFSDGDTMLFRDWEKACFLDDHYTDGGSHRHQHYIRLELIEPSAFRLRAIPFT